MKKVFAPILLLLTLLSVMACNTPKVYTDYDETKNFDTYRHFNFYEDIESGLDTLDHVRLQKALQKELQTKGFSKTEDPEFYINFYVDYRKETNQNNVGISIGTIGSHVGGNIASGIPIRSNRRIMEVTVEMVDAQRNTLYWQGKAEVRVKNHRTPEKRTALFTEIAESLFKKYPPK